MAESPSTTQLANAINLLGLSPPGMSSGAFRNNEGRDIYYTKSPALAPKIGTVVFTPGYGDSVNFHYDAIQNFRQRGYDVYAMDWIGQGLSDRENPAHITSPNDRLITRHMLDLHTFVTDVVRKEESGPLIMATHSMGGNIGMLYLKHFPNTFAGAVMGAPLIDLNTSILPRSAFKGLVYTANKIGLDDDPLPNWRHILNRVSAASDNIRNLTREPEQLTLAQEAQERIRQLFKPVEIGLPTWGFIRRVYPNLDDMRQESYYKDIKTPVLMFAAGRDELVSNEAISFAAKNLPHGKAVTLPTAEHGVWNSNAVSHEQMWKALDEFLVRDVSNPAGQLAPVRPSSPPPVDKTIRPAAVPVAAFGGLSLSYG